MEERTNEIVLEYSRKPQEIVLEYAGKAPEALPTVPVATIVPQKKKNKFLKVLFGILGIAVACALCVGIGMFLGNTFFNNNSNSNSKNGNGSGYYNIITTKEETSIPVIKAEAGVQMTIERTHGKELTAQEVYALCNPATVTVVCPSNSGTSMGTGAIFTQDGYVITNEHVISGANSCYIILSTGAQYNCDLIGYDANNDIAVLKAQNASELPTVTFGDSDQLVVGDPVYAIGNPLSLDLRGTMTNGIVSAVERTMTTNGKSLTVMQTNAALNSGNSGGPLINAYGQVIGINSIKMSSSDSSSTASIEGLGFALPTTTVIYTVNDLLSMGTSRGEPSFGLTIINLPQMLPIGRSGLLVQSVNVESAAEKAGFQAGDYILEADGKSVSSTIELIHIRRTHVYGDTMTFLIYRDGKTQTLTLTLQ